MGIIQTIALIFIALVIISTFITEPKLSAEYYKSTGKSAVILIKKIKDFVMEWKQDDKVPKEDMQEVQGN